MHNRRRMSADTGRVNTLPRRSDTLDRNYNNCKKNKQKYKSKYQKERYKRRHKLTKMANIQWRVTVCGRFFERMLFEQKCPRMLSGDEPSDPPEKPPKRSFPKRSP